MSSFEQRLQQLEEKIERQESYHQAQLDRLSTAVKMLMSARAREYTYGTIVQYQFSGISDAWVKELRIRMDVIDRIDYACPRPRDSGFRLITVLVSRTPGDVLVMTWDLTSLDWPEVCDTMRVDYEGNVTQPFKFPTADISQYLMRYRTLFVRAASTPAPSPPP